MAWHTRCVVGPMGRSPHTEFDWNLLKTFHAVARTGSVSAAARDLRREQPSVSSALKRLEDHFGVALCVRTSRGIVLTTAGKQALEACVGVDRIVGQLSEDLGETSNDIDATLTLRTISDVIAPSLDRAMVAFHKAFPRVEIKVDIAPWRQVIESVQDNKVTLGIACDNAPSSKLAYHPLMVEAQQLYCGAGHPLFGSAPMAPGRLRDDAFVLTGDDEPEDLLRFRLAHDLGRRSCGTADTLHEARKLIQMGFGIGFLPTVVAEASGAQLWPLLPPDILPTYPLFIVTKRDAKRPPQMQRLLDAFLAEIPTTAP